jgi:hypothetical protein
MSNTGLQGLLTPENSVLIQIDHQPFRFANLHSHEPTVIVNNIIGLGRTISAMRNWRDPMNTQEHQKTSAWPRALQGLVSTIALGCLVGARYPTLSRAASSVSWDDWPYVNHDTYGTGTVLSIQSTHAM